MSITPTGSPAGPPIDPGVRTAAKWIALILFLLYLADFIWKLAHWSQYSAGIKSATLAILISVRVVFMAFLLWIYLRARRTT